MSNKLVAYFSCTNSTENVAKTVAKAVEADIYKIEPKVPYTQADLDWNDRNSRTSVEMRDFSCRPEIVGGVHNMSSYDIVLIGFPIWWYNAPNIIKTFLESYDFSGKKLACFATSGSGDIVKAEAVLKSLVKSADWLDGKILNNETEINEWISQLEI